MKPSRVRTHSGYKADEYPTHFTDGEIEYQVMDIEDRWYGPETAYFRVLADNSGTYILRKNLRMDQWQVQRLGER